MKHNINRIHFVGIGGSGMSGIAEVMHNLGYFVSGSDIQESLVTSRLKEIGIKIFINHAADNIKDVDVLVISAFKKKYIPMPNTVIKGLEDNSGVIISKLALNPMIDLKNSLNCWLSYELENKYFKHILCVEGIKPEIKL